MKVTSVVVALLSLLLLCDLAFSALDCGENGVQIKKADKSYCSCYSGYAPSDRTQKDCNADAQCPPRESIDTATTTGGYPAKLFNATFKADAYNLIIRLPIVTGRRNASVSFSNGEGSCGYPGNLWYKRVNTLDCVDEFVGAMPWSSHSQCGFSDKIIRGSKTTYTASLMVTYDQLVLDEDGADILRPSGVLLRVNVTFTTRTSLVFSFIDLNAGNTYVKVAVVGDVVYDANTIRGTIVLRTKSTWPYSVEGINMFKAPGVNQAVISADTNFDQRAGCTNVTKSECTQQYVMRINPNGGCNIGGNYVFNITLGCRIGNNGFDICGGLSYTSRSYTVKIYDTDICGVGGVDVQLSNGQLLPFSDQEGNTPASSFLPNAKVYFSYSITSDAATIDTISVDSITASTTAGVTDVLYDASSAATGPTVKGVAAGLAIVPATTPVAPGTPATLWFQVQLVDAVSSFRVLPSNAATVTMTIIVNVQYHGNAKRTIQAVASVTTSKGLTDIYVSGTAEDDAIISDNSSASLSPISPFIFFALALVLMTALRF